MIAYVIRRLLASLPTLLGVVTVVFFLVRVLPGDPARVIAGPQASPADVERLRESLGLSESIPSQYKSYLIDLAHGDLGVSASTGEPVLSMLMTAFPYTLKLAVVSLTLALVFGLAAGIIAAARSGTWIDVGVSATALFGLSMPVYWLGLILIIIFAVELQVLPAAGATEPFSIVLPSITLAATLVAPIARMTRSSMLEELGQDYFRTARAKGASWNRAILRHALRNAFLPVLTTIGLLLGVLLGGAVLTETVFGWPGLGQLMINAIASRDYPVLQGAVLLFAIGIVFVNLLVDLLYGFIDPRVRYR